MESREVLAERAIDHCWAAVVIVHAATGVCRIKNKVAVGDRRVALMLVVHAGAPSTVTDGHIPSERAVDHRGAAARVVHPCAGRIGAALALTISGRDREPVEDGRRIGIAPDQDMKAVLAIVRTDDAEAVAAAKTSEGVTFR